MQYESSHRQFIAGKCNTRWLAALWLISCLFQTSYAQTPKDYASPSNLQDQGAETNRLALFKHLSLEELLNEDVTSVSREPEPYKNAPASLVVIHSEDIRRSGASSLPEALRLADNLEVAQASSSTWNISARGFNGSVANKLLVLIDGRSVYTPLFSGVIWNNQDYLLEDLDRIEVISGPGGTLWGANAVNGVINIISKHAKDTQGAYVTAGGGTWLQDFVGARYGGTITSNVYYRIYGKYFDRDSQVFRDGSDAHDAWNRGQGGFRIDFENSPNNHLTLDSSGYAGRNDVVPGGEGSPRAVGSSSGGHLLGRWTHSLGEDSDLTLQTYYDRTHLDAAFQGAGTIPPGILTDDLDTFDLDFQHRFGLGERQHFVWGMEYRFTHDVVREAPLVAFLPPTLDQNLFSAFVQDEIKIFEPVHFTLGTKLEHYDYTGFEYEPNARLQWNVTDHQTLWGAISRAVREPSRFDRDLYEPNPAFGTLLVGNNSFQSETVLAYEMGYRAQLFRQLSASLSAFYNDYGRLRSLNLTPPGVLPVRYENHLKGDSYGTELSANYQPVSWWRLHVGCDLLKETIIVGPQGDINGGLNETADPQQQVFFRSSMNLGHSVEWDANVRWIDIVHNNNGATPGTVPSYAELDMRLAWYPTKNVELSLVGQNLVHDQHPEAGFPGPTQEEIVRSVYGRITFRW